MTDMSTNVIPFPGRPAPVVNSEITRTAGRFYKETADLDLTEVAKLVRRDLRVAKDGGSRVPRDAKISVRISRYSMGQALIVRITLPRVTRHPVDGDRPDLDWVSTPEAVEVYDVAATIAGNYNRSESDVLTDYSRSRFHLDLKVDGPSPL
jgi:hypothetical protein